MTFSVPFVECAAFGCCEGIVTSYFHLTFLEQLCSKQGSYYGLMDFVIQSLVNLIPRFEASVYFHELMTDPLVQLSIFIYCHEYLE